MSASISMSGTQFLLHRRRRIIRIAANILRTSKKKTVLEKLILILMICINLFVLELII